MRDGVDGALGTFDWARLRGVAVERRVAARAVVVRDRVVRWCASFSGARWSVHPRRMQPITRSANGFYRIHPNAEIRLDLDPQLVEALREFVTRF